MNVRPIHSEADYKAALKAVSRHFDNEPEPGTEDARGGRADVVGEDAGDETWPLAERGSSEADELRVLGVVDPALALDEVVTSVLGELAMAYPNARFEPKLDRVRGSEVALKTLRSAGGRELYRFKREFRALADIVHPNLVTLHELHAAEGDWYFTMELVEGVSFIDWVRPSAANVLP